MIYLPKAPKDKRKFYDGVLDFDVPWNFANREAFENRESDRNARIQVTAGCGGHHGEREDNSKAVSSTNSQ